MKKRIAWILAAMMVLSCVASCGAADKDKSQSADNKQVVAADKEKEVSCGSEEKKAGTSDEKSSKEFDQDDDTAGDQTGNDEKTSNNSAGNQGASGTNQTVTGDNGKNGNNAAGSKTDTGNKGNSSSTSTSSSKTETGSTSSGGSTGNKTDTGNKGNTGSAADQQPSKPSEPVKEEHSHTWVEQTQTIQHEATGHYETKVVKEAWDESVYDYRLVCLGCGHMSMTADEAGNHCIECESGKGYSSRKVVVDTIHHAAETEQTWIVDKPAWIETKVIGYKCSGCGAIK